ncbi:MAG: hypothetical protein J6A79_11105 [Clostridia bacterium]|nr:hypothetical protein [Clostridia bacterium]
MERDLKPLREKMVSAMVYDGWQFVQNAITSIDTAYFCVDTIGKIIKQHEDAYNSWFDGIGQEIAKKKEKGEEMKVAITSERLPRYVTVVAGMEVNSSFLLQKLTNDFFQYTRNTFDYIAQIANVSLLRERRKNIESVDFPRMKDVFEQQTYSQEFPTIHSWFDQISNSQEYIYLDDFCNRTKHISDIYIRLSIPFFGGESKATVNPFYKKATDHPSQNIKTYLKSIWNYVFQALCSFLTLLETEIEKTTSNNRFHQLLGYQQVIKDSPENSFAFAYVVAPNNDANAMPEGIGILLLQQDHEDGRVDACNCNLDNIYICNPADKLDVIGVYKAEEQWHPDQVLLYRKYKKSIPAQDDLPLIFQIMQNPQHRNMRFYPNPYMTFMSIEA